MAWHRAHSGQHLQSSLAMAADEACTSCTCIFCDEVHSPISGF